MLLQLFFVVCGQHPESHLLCPYAGFGSMCRRHVPVTCCRPVESRQGVEDAASPVVVQQDAESGGEVLVPEAVHVVEEAEVARQQEGGLFRYGCVAYCR